MLLYKYNSNLSFVKEGLDGFQPLKAQVVTIYTDCCNVKEVFAFSLFGMIFKCWILSYK